MLAALDGRPARLLNLTESALPLMALPALGQEAAAAACAARSFSAVAAGAGSGAATAEAQVGRCV